MRITFIALILICFGLTASLAQTNYSVKGKVADTVSNSNLVNASVSVISAKDSILQKFTRVKDDGTFTITNLNKGKFILVATYPGYADFVERFTLDSAHTTHSFGTVSMLLKERLLKEVIVKGKAAAIKIKGDTTEFNPAAYNIQPNSKVEDLLKQLPGIEVDKDGKITAQGQTVKKVLVDGEEFFGDDPTLVTKNLRADMVDKVQLYDKKSDQAAFTGIDDGVKDKTINIKLKEDKKNGYFGKLDGGIGTDGYYQGQALFNRFKGKQKFSLYGTLGNNGKTGLGWEDNNKYGGGGGMEMSDDGGFYFFSGGGDDLDNFSGRYNGEGKPIARTGGAHFDTKWNGDKESLNANYKIGSLTVDGTKNTQTLNSFPGNISNVNSDETNHNYLFRQKLDLNYQVKIDSMQNLKITADGTLRNTNTRSNFATKTARLDGSLINSNGRDNTADVDSKVFNASAFYTKKFKKKSRTLSVNFRTSIDESDSKGFLKSKTTFFDSVGVFKRDTTIDQFKANKTRSTNINTNITYTEPLVKDFTLALSYAISVNNANNDRRTFNKPVSTASAYSALDSLYSSDYKLNQLSNQGGAVFNLQKKSFTFNFGTKVAGVKFKQVDEFGRRSDLVRNFTNWFPQASFQYKISKQSSIRVSYNGNTTQPSLDDIQPVLVNTDPLNIRNGNAGLKPSFTNRYNISYNSYKVISNQYIWISGSYSTTSNPIVSNVVRDTTTGISTYKSSNLNRSTSNFWANSYFERKIPGVDINAGFELSANGNTYYNLSNNILNETKSYSYSGSLRFSKYKEKKYDAWISGGPNYTVNSSSLNKTLNNNGRGFNANGGFNIYLPGKFQIGSDGNYTYNAPTKSFPQDFRRFLLNANISRTFFKDALKAAISGNDLLNQNTGYNRSGAANIITQERYTTIRRYFMFSLTWDFNKVGGGAPKK